MVILVRVSVGQKHNDERSSLPLYSQNYVGRVPWQIIRRLRNARLAKFMGVESNIIINLNIYFLITETFYSKYSSFRQF